MKTAPFAALVVLALGCTQTVAASGTSGGGSGTSSRCGPATCSGCCAADGSCQSGLDAGACGSLGGACDLCDADELCTHGVCALIGGCLANGTACSHASDCCSADCTLAGLCATPSLGSSSSGSSGGASGGSLGCTAPASYNAKNGGACGSFRWGIKTGTDSASSAISLSPTPTTVAQLDAIPAPSGVNAGPSSRYPGAEGTLYVLKNVTLLETKLEPDSDYHMPVTDGTASMETEIPFPGCVGGQSPWGCEITHARAALEHVLVPTGSYQKVNQTVTIVGVGFFDLLHGSASQAPNGIELHPVLALCFGVDCDPFAN